MARHNVLGEQGEKMAIEWLKEKGYEILHRNWRHKYHEIDIIATKNKKLHIIEVKSRNATPFGNPEDSVTRSKFKRLQRATDEFLHLHPVYPWIQYDIMAITIARSGAIEYFLIEDVFL